MEKRGDKENKRFDQLKVLKFYNVKLFDSSKIEDTKFSSAFFFMYKVFRYIILLSFVL